MPPDPRELFDAAFANFLDVERTLIETGASERSLCARLLLHLERQKWGTPKFQSPWGGLFVDVDYNRMQNRDIKAMWQDERPVRIQCDVLVHSRTRPDNLIAIEMKKSTVRQWRRDRDRRRLEVLTSKPDALGVMVYGGTPEYVCGYQLGLYLELNEEERFFLVEEYRDGRLAREPETLRIPPR